MVNVWKVAPGRGASMWTECRDRTCITINWLNEIDLTTFQDIDEIEQAIIHADEGAGRGAGSIWPFVHDIRKGHIVVANRGLSKVMGIGVVTSHYIPPDHPKNPNSDREFHLQTRRVNWRITSPVDLRKRLFNQPTVQQLSSTQCDVIKRAYLKDYPKFAPILDDLFPVRMSEVDAGHENTPYELNGNDLRQTVEREIKERRGQQQFREALRLRFSDRCVVTGCNVVDVLEAAHISPYRGAKDHHVENGLLLRADIHTLFDLNLLSINPVEMKIVLHPKLSSNKEYARLAGRTLRCSGSQKPSAKALKERYKQFCEALGE